MAFVIPRDTATFSAPETASFDVEEAGVISDEAAEEESEEEPSTFKIDMFSDERWLLDLRGIPYFLYAQNFVK